MAAQLALNFNGKADNVVSFRADDRLNDDLKYLAKALGRKSTADLVKEYVIECVSRDIGIIRLKEARGEKIVCFHMTKRTKKNLFVTSTDVAGCIQ